MQKHNVFIRGWVMALLAFLLAVVTQGFGIYHFSMLKTSIADTVGGSSTEVALAYSCYVLSMALVGLFVGKLIERWGLRFSLLLSALLYAGGFLLLSVAYSLPMLYCAYIVMGAGSSFGGVVVITSIPSNWFVKHRGVANGLIWSATFVGSLFVTNFIAAATVRFDWQLAVRLLAVIAFAVILVVAVFLRWRPQDVGLLPDGLSEEQAAQEGERAGSARIVGLSLREALGSRTFWLLAVAIFMIGIGEMGVFQNTASYLVVLGNPLAVVAVYMSLIGLVGFFGKLLGGVVIDKVGARMAYFLIELVAAAGLFMLMFASPESSAVYMGVAIALFGIGENASIVCFSACTGKYLGIKNYAQIFGFVFLAKALGDAVGAPLIAGLAESPLGWPGAFCIAAILCIVSAAVFFFAKKEERLVKLESEAMDAMACEER